MGLNAQPGLMERARRFALMHLTGVDPQTGMSLGMIPIGPGGLQGPTRGIGDMIKQLAGIAGTNQASMGGMMRPGVSTANLPPYIFVNRMATEDPQAWMAPISDMHLGQLKRYYGAMSPSDEGALAERLGLTPSTHAGYIDELNTLLAMIFGPMLHLKR